MILAAFRVNVLHPSRREVMPYRPRLVCRRQIRFSVTDGLEVFFVLLVRGAPKEVVAERRLLGGDALLRGLLRIGPW